MLFIKKLFAFLVYHLIFFSGFLTFFKLILKYIFLIILSINLYLRSENIFKSIICLKIYHVSSVNVLYNMKNSEYKNLFFANNLCFLFDINFIIIHVIRLLLFDTKKPA